MSPLRPTGFTVLYDADCPVCRRARRWAERQRQLVPLEFVAAGSTEARDRFPGLDVDATRREITVVADDGAVLRDEDAWLSVLWATAAARPTATRLLGRSRRPLFRTLKTATETIRSITSQPTDPAPLIPTADWPPPVDRTTKFDRS